jgi:RimJ/RimL family protein N-acetyltransferase
MGIAWIGGHAEAWRKGVQATFAITEPAIGLLGAVGLRIEEAHRRAELGYWIAVPYWGRGFATEAARAVLEFGFGPLGLRRIHATHLSRNPASGRVMEKLGMRLEGVRRQHILKWNRAEDLTVYGILRDEFPAL